ncbi:hypothetical protein Tco_0673439 [Tanacetum coccineum]
MIAQITRITAALGWYLDSGATIHVVGSRNSFTTYHAVTSRQVMMANRDRADVCGVGTVHMKFTSGKTVTLHNVLHVPTISKSLVSVGKLDEHGFKIAIESRKEYLLEEERVITEYLVNISKRRAFWSLNEDIFKIYYSEYQYAVSIKEDTAYPCLHSPKTTKERRSIRRIQKKSIRRIEDIVCEYSGRYQTWSLLQETLIRRIQSLGYACRMGMFGIANMANAHVKWGKVVMICGEVVFVLFCRVWRDFGDDEQWLEEEKARKRRKVFNWDAAKYGKIWYDEDIHDLRSVKSEFPAIIFNNEVSPETLSCEPTVSSLNDEIDFRVLFDDSDDEDYTVIFEKNSFSYKKFSSNDLKTDSENDSEKVMPSLPSPEPTVSCFDDLDFFKDFENEFPAIVYNDAQTSKSDLLTGPNFNPQYIDEFDLNDETSLSEYKEKEQNVLYFNDLFPFNIIHFDDLKSEKDNDDNDIDIILSSEGNDITHGSNMFSETSHDKITKIFRTGSFVINLNVNIMI